MGVPSTWSNREIEAEITSACIREVLLGNSEKKNGPVSAFGLREIGYLNQNRRGERRPGSFEAPFKFPNSSRSSTNNLVDAYASENSQKPDNAHCYIPPVGSSNRTPDHHSWSQL